MFILAAPYPSLQTTTVLPSPQFGDTDGITDSVNIQEAMDGTLYSTIKQPGRNKFRWDFVLTRNKGLELAYFYKAYAGQKIKIVDHENQTWVGYLTVNPFEGRSDAAAFPALQGWPRGERVTASIEFEGEQI